MLSFPIPYFQALRLNRIGQKLVLDKQYKDLEVWLRERRYSEELVRKQILKARTFSRTELLNKQRKE